jgi:hypothetical protein
MQKQHEDLGINGIERPEDVHDWLDGAIRAAVDTKHGSPGRAPHPSAPRPPAPPSDQKPGGGSAMPPASPRRIGEYAKSDPSFRHSLDPIRVAIPAYNSSEGRSSPFLRYGLIIGGAAIVAYGIATFSPQPRRVAGAADAVPIAAVAQSEAPLTPRLIVHDEQVFTNDPLPLDVVVDRSVANASLRVAGLAAGTHLSAGSPVGDSGWSVPLDGLKNLFMYAPTDFVGVMHSAVDLRGPDKKLIDRREMKLEWVERKKDPSRFGEPNAAANTTPASALTKEASLSQDPLLTKTPNLSLDTGVSPIAPPVLPQVITNGAVAKDPVMSRETAQSLMERGEDSLKSGDIVTARMLFTRLADAGIGDAAFAAAETYDPHYLAAHNVLGFPGDEAKAREYYQRAAQLGSTEAVAHLAGAVAK